MYLSSLTAAALAAAILAAASVLIFAQLPDLFVWAAFIGWASYDHSGANAQAALRSSAALIFGVVMAWAVAIVVTAGVMPLTATIASFLIVAASQWPLLSIVPATFYGFASTFAYLSLAPGAFSFGAMTTLSWRNAIVAVPISLAIGTGLGIAHGRLAEILASADASSNGRRAIRLGGSHQ